MRKISVYQICLLKNLINRTAGDCVNVNGKIHGGVRNRRGENDDHKLKVTNVQDCCNSICKTDCTYVPIDANLPMAY